MSLTDLQSLTLNLGPCILRREVYTSEQLDSLVLSDDNPESITKIVFDHFGINIVNDYQDTMVLLEAVFESDDLSIQMKKGIEKFCLEKMKELEGQPEYLGHDIEIIRAQDTDMSRKKFMEKLHGKNSKSAEEMYQDYLSTLAAERKATLDRWGEIADQYAREHKENDLGSLERQTGRIP